MRGVPRIPRYLNSTQNQKRIGGTLTFQWQPDSATDISLDLLYSRFDVVRRDNYIAGLSFGRSATNNGQPVTSVKDVQLSPKGSLVYGLFDGVDVILAPATPCRAPKGGQTHFVIDGVTLPVRANIGLFTQPISFIGLPVVAVPVRLDAGLPLGVQVIAAPWREDLALRVARQLERDGICTAPVAELG